MYCDVCMGEGKHNPRCPNYCPPKAAHYCNVCGDGIYAGEEYIENDDGECCHYECFWNTKEELRWLGHEVKIMEEEDCERNY